jgi:hypothetical protein
MNDKQLEDLHAHFTELYGGQMLDETRPLEERHLTVLVNRRCLPAGPGGPAPRENGENPAKTVAGSSAETELRSVQECAKEVLYRQLKHLSLAMYLAMEKNKNWGSLGEQRVRISLCRNIMNIPNNREVTQFDTDRLRLIVDRCDASLGKKSAEEMDRYCEKKRISLFGKDFFDFPELGEFIKLFDAEYLFYSAGRLYGPKFIFGEVAYTQIDDTLIYTFLDEYIRSPHNDLSIAGRAIYSSNSIQIRRVALEAICFNKWQNFFETSKAERRRCLRHPNTAIREALKEKAMAWYGITGSGDFLKFKDKLLDAMTDGVIWHEFGHHVSEQPRDMDPVHRAVYFGEVQGGDVLDTLGELLAEWAPARGGKKGALIRFLETAGSDSKAAAAQFYMFLSDSWYVDEKEELFSLKSNCYLGLGLYFMGPGGAVNFKRMAREHGVIYEFLMGEFRRVVGRILGFLSRAAYVKDGRPLFYDDLETEILKSRQEKNPALTAEKMKEDFRYWENVLTFLSENDRKRFRVLMAQEAAALEHNILDMVTGGNTMEYRDSLRQYIVERCEEIGLYSPPMPVKIKKTIQKACEKLGIPQEEITRVYDRFNSIMDGKKYEAVIRYNGPPDPFIGVLQEMMLETGIGAILSGMLLGEGYESEKDYISLEECVKNELENIRDQLESGRYQQIDLLKVNKLYADLSLVQGMLPAIKFLGGGSLESKIKAIESVSFDNDAILEAVIPLRRGYMDWNTSQAVWRINQDLRPDEFMLLWTIDQDFLEFLFDAYAD